MIRKTLAVLLLLLPAVPALAKSDQNFYPVSCDVLWTAVTSTLNNPSDYGILFSDDINHRASFVVVGDLVVFKNVVMLSSRDKGCSIKLIITQIGADNSNERSFRGRLKRTLAKMQRPQPSLSIGGVSTASAAGGVAQPAAVPAPGAPAKPQMTPQTGAGGIWGSTLTSQVVVRGPTALKPEQRSGDKPPSVISPTSPAGY